MDKIVKQKAHLYDMLKKEIGGGIMQVQNNVLEQLLAAHHPNKSFLEKNSNHYYYERFSVAEIRADQGHVSEPFQHSHDAYEFLIPYGPIPMLMCEGAVFFGEVGYVYPVQSQKVHAFRFRASGVSYDSIVVEKSYMEELMKKTFYGNREFSGKMQMRQELSFYISIFKKVYASSSSKDMKGWKLKNLAELICLELIGMAFGNTKEVVQEEWEYRQGMAAVALYMNQHYKEKLTIEELAEMAGLSKNYFISSFKKYMGEPPHTYLKKLRISYAKLLLEFSEETIAQIAEQCGFQKANTFSTTFKKATGMSPMEYKKNQSGS